jgi:alkylated DNA nucleotide flippase Atl1
MTPELNWAGQPIRPGEDYGGTSLHIPKTPEPEPVQAVAKQQQHFAVITEEDVAKVFGHGEYELERPEAAKLLQQYTNAHRTSCYRALRLKGRFSRHLHANGKSLSWH